MKYPYLILIIAICWREQTSKTSLSNDLYNIFVTYIITKMLTKHQCLKAMVILKGDQCYALATLVELIIV